MKIWIPLLLMTLPFVCLAGTREAWEILGSKEVEQLIRTSERADTVGVILSVAEDASFTVVAIGKERSLPPESVADLKDVLTRSVPNSKGRISSGFKPRFRVRLHSGEKHVDILIESELNGFVVWSDQHSLGGRGGMDGYRPIIKRALRRTYSEDELDRIRKMPNRVAGGD